MRVNKWPQLIAYLCFDVLERKKIFQSEKTKIEAEKEGKIRLMEK